MRVDSEGWLVEAYCADYGRRERLAADMTVPLRTRIECRYINRRLYDAVRECCRDRDEALLFLREIGERRGYASSDTTLCETAYKQKKCAIRRNILRKLHLV